MVLYQVHPRDKLATSRVGRDHLHKLDKGGQRLYTVQPGYLLRIHYSGQTWTSYLADDVFYTIFNITTSEVLIVLRSLASLSS